MVKKGSNVLYECAQTRNCRHLEKAWLLLGFFVSAVLETACDIRGGRSNPVFLESGMVLVYALPTSWAARRS